MGALMAKKRRGRWTCTECGRQNTASADECTNCGYDSPYRDMYQKRGWAGQCEYMTEDHQCRIPVSTSIRNEKMYCAWHQFWLSEEPGRPPTLQDFCLWIASRNELRECSPWTHYDPEWVFQLSIGGYPKGRPVIGACEYKFCTVAQKTLSTPEWASRLGRPVPQGVTRNEIMRQIVAMVEGGKPLYQKRLTEPVEEETDA